MTRNPVKELTLTKPFRYQRIGINRIKACGGRILLADEMGLGKTIQALRYVYEEVQGLTIIVTPANAKYNWQREALVHCGMRSIVLEGRQPRPLGDLRKLPPIIIVNYDILPFWLSYLRKLKPHMVILDEVHYTANRASKRSKATRKLACRCPKLIAISGTPLTYRPAEMFTALNLLWPDVFDSWPDYARRYCQPKRTFWGWEYKGAARLPELHRNLIRLGMIRRLKSEVLHELPAKTRVVVPLPLSNPREYKKAHADFKAWAQKTLSKGKSRKALRAGKLVVPGYLRRLVADLKLPAVIQWVRDFLAGTDEKLVLFGIHKKVIHALAAAFPKISVVVDGSVNSQERLRRVDQFQNRKAIRLFIGNIDAAGTALNLTAGTALAFAELDWIPGKHTQAEDRIHRIGQRMAVFVYYLVAQNTIEERICSLLQTRQGRLEATLDGRDVKQSTLTLFDEMVRSVLQE